MGKNTMVRRAIRNILADNPQYERILPLVRGNIGFVFTSGDLKDVRDIITANKVAAPAKAGAFAPLDVYIPAGNTGMEPGKTSFFQALGIPTKVNPDQSIVPLRRVRFRDSNFPMRFCH
jgi:large subunit ribosomal protein LP0